MDYFSSNKFERFLLANLEINKEGIFQDKVVPVSREIRSSLEKGKGLVDSYCKFLPNIWAQGFSEKVYKFSENYGVNYSGEGVLMDFAERRFTKEETLRDILSKGWKRVNSDKRNLKGKLRNYYELKIEELLTPKNLDKYWENKKRKTA